MALSQRKAGRAWRRFQTVARPTAGGYTKVKPGAGSARARKPMPQATDKSVIFYAGYADLDRDVRTLADKLPPECDGVVGLPNSGLLPAKLLSEACGAPLYSIGSVPDTVRCLVVVEDATQFARFKQTYAHLEAGRRVLWTAVYACEQALTLLDAYAAEAPKPRVFAWNLHKYKNTRRFLFDIDGIVCKDPVGHQYEEPAYSEFIRTATPILRPLSSAGVLTGEKPDMGTFVTGRKEAYRAATETWLRQHIASWQGLVMRPDDAERGSNAIAEFKARVYARSSAPLFVESSEKQAELIHKITGKPAVCLARGFGTRGAVVRPVTASMPSVRTGNRRVIYTISTGAYANVAAEKFKIPAGWDYVRVTDADCPAYLSPKQRAAWAKITGPRLFKAYDASLCIDDDMSVLKDPYELFNGTEFAALKRKALARMSDDWRAIIHARRAATEAAVKAESQRYAAAGFVDGPMWLSGVLFRRHTGAVLQLCDEWLYWYIQSETQRDQPSMNVAIQATGLTPLGLGEHTNLRGYIHHKVRKADEAGVRMRVS